MRRAALLMTALLLLLAPARAGAASPPGEGRLTPLAPPGGCWSELANAGCFDSNELSHAADVVVSPDSRFAYVASYDSSSVTGFRLDPQTGAIKERVACFSKTPAFGCPNGNGLDGARGLALSPDGKTLYVASAFHVTNDGAIASFARNPSTGALTELNCKSVKGTGGCGPDVGLEVAQNISVSEDGKRLYVSAYYGGPSGGAITMFSVLGSGAIGAEQACATGTIGGAPGCQESSTVFRPQGIAVSGRELFFAAAADGGAVLSYHLKADGTFEFPDACIAETASGSLCLVDGAGLAGADGLVLSANGRNVYVSSGGGGGAIASFSRKSTGQLDAELNCFDASGNQFCRRGHGLTGALGVGIGPDGANVYLGSADGLAGFTVDPATGELDNEVQCLRAAADANCAGGAPGATRATGIAVTGDNRAVYVAAQMTGAGGALSVFRRELAPVCKPTSAQAVSGLPRTIAVACTDPNGDALSRAYSIPAHGSLSGAAGGGVTYRSAPGYLGPDSFTVRASDGILESSPVAVKVTVRRDQPPSSRIATLASTLKAAKLKRFTGTARDDVGLRRVDVAVTAGSGKACLRLAKDGTLKPGDCKKPVWLRAKGTAKWRFALKKPLPKGRYVVRSRATDSAGHRERRFTAARGNRRAFTLTGA